MPHPLLRDVVVLFALAVGAALVCHRLRVPLLVGFLLTGAVAGPHGLGLVQGVRAVEILAEVGLVVLLFTIGVEFSLAEMLDLKRPALAGGTLQVGMTAAAGASLGLAAGRPWAEALFLGFLLSLSSTAVVVRVLEARADLHSPHGRTTLGILLFQDLAAVPMMLAVPILAGRAAAPGGSLWRSLGLGLLVVAAAVAGARWVVPRLFLFVTRTRDREAFLLTVLVLVFATAWLTSGAGLSLALGAFLAGLVLSESDYGHQALASLLPFRDAFTSLFFVSMGMLLDLSYCAADPGGIGALAAAVVVVKGGLAALAGAWIGLPLRTSLLAGVALAQVGEFSFVIARSGLEHGLLAEERFQTFLAVSVVTLAATPLLVSLAPRLVEWIQRRRRADAARLSPDEPAAAGLADHLVIVGFGLNGRNLARAAGCARIPYVVLEINPDLVREGRAAGQPVVYGDGTEETVLTRAGIRSARVAVVAVSDPAATRRIVSVARRLGPGVCVIARTRYVGEIGPLLELGADHVIPEEFETSIEIFTRVLRHYLVPEEEILRLTAEARSGVYDLLRRSEQGAARGGEPARLEADIRSVEIGPGSVLDGKSLAEAELRRRFGVTVVAVRSGEALVGNPDPDRTLRAGDRLVVMGNPVDIGRLVSAARGRDEP